MKAKRSLWVVLVFTALSLTGCFSLLKNILTEDRQFSFAGNERASRTASITFVGEGKVGVRLVDFEGNVMPAPEKGTEWLPAILFPAGRPLNIRVYVYWNEDRYGERRRGIFTCPPLEAGKEYKLQFSGNLNGGTLTLLGANSNLFNRDVVYEQRIPPPPK